MQFQEAQHLLQPAAESEFERHHDGNAMAERIREWLGTPEGSVAHHPSWGHNLEGFKHDPLSPNGSLATLMELALVRKLPLDIEDLQLQGVLVEVQDIDYVRISILHQFGGIVEEIKL